MKYSADEYVGFDPFEGDRDVDIRCQTVKVVKVRKQHECHLSLIDNKPHFIEVGELARLEKALVDDEKWGSYYCCLPCMDAWFDEMGYGLSMGGE